MAPTVHSTRPLFPWQPGPTVNPDAYPLSYSLYIGDSFPGVTLARLALYFDPYLQRWTWEVNITDPRPGREGYTYGHARTWPRAERDALLQLARMLHAEPTYLAPTYLGSLFDAFPQAGEVS